MLIEETKKDIFGCLEGPEPDTAIFKVVTFVEKCLVEFSRENTGSTINNEKGLTQKLCILLNFYLRYEGHPFWFDKEYMEEVERGDSPQVDIGVISSMNEGIAIGSRFYSNRESFFSMEAKRLDETGKAREKEYLVGRIENGKYRECGGVERFKKGIHGKKLKYAAIIGYVQKHDFDYWHHTINAWIDQLINGLIATSTQWSEKDKLVVVYKKQAAAKFKSENSRQNGSIFLFHLWVNLVKP
jgi:hypothetical protein